MGNNGAKMGGLCGTDYFQKMKDKYGDDAVKFVVIRKCRDFVTAKFSDVGMELNKIFAETEAETSKLAEHKKREVREAFQKMKIEINDQVPGGVKKLEDSKGETLEDAIDLEKYISQITEARERALGRIQQERNLTNDQIKAKHKAVMDNINSQCPSIPIFNDMPQVSQRQIMRKGEEQFASQIQGKKEQIEKQIDEQVDFEVLRVKLSAMVPVEEMNQLASTPKTVFSLENGITGEVIQRLKQM